MKLKDILPGLRFPTGTSMLEVKDISDDTRLAKTGDIFFIKERDDFDIFPALKKIEDKVKVFVAEDKAREKLRALSLRKPEVFVKDIAAAFTLAADKFYGYAKNDFICIGITGTKGKTTTAYLVKHLLTKFKQNCALISTIEYIIGNKTYTAQNTTPGYLELRKIFKKIRDNGAKFVVMEVSSHGISQQRIAGIKFSRCVFTNLKREHLDYHKNMREYFNVKKSFFTANKNAIAVINSDDFYGRKIKKEAKNAFFYGTQPHAHLRATEICLNKQGITFQLHCQGKTFTVRANILGRHNVYNILAAIGVVFSLGFPLQDSVRFVESFSAVEGRLQEVAPDIFVDYAHTPDSLAKAILAIKDIGYKKVVCVFGCGGNRDTGKRKIMGRIASKLADFSVITSDNPRNESPADICSQIKKGFKKKNYSIVIDRKDAIEKALGLKRKYTDSCLLVAGKGHEGYQIIGSDKIPFKDKEIILKFLKK